MADLELSLREFLKSAPRNDDEMHAYADKLGMSPHDLETKVYGIAYKALSGQYFKHGDDADAKFDPDELAQGAEIEKEHTDDEDLAVKIAKAHLAEIPDYYSRLKDMETKAKQERKEQIEMKNAMFGSQFPLLRSLVEADSGEKIWAHTWDSHKIDDHKKTNWQGVSSQEHKDYAKYHREKAKKVHDQPGGLSWAALSKKHKEVAAFHDHAAEHKDWFGSLSPEQQAQYKKLHPKSKLV